MSKIYTLAITDEDLNLIKTLEQEEFDIDLAFMQWLRSKAIEKGILKQV